MDSKTKMGSLEKKLSLQKSMKTTEEMKKSVDAKMRRSISDKSLLPGRFKKKEDDPKSYNNRYLVIINVLGSTGPIQFLVNRDSNVKLVIEKALKLHTREGRLPVIGSDINNFCLCPADRGSNDTALKLMEPIGSCEARRFVLCKQQSEPDMTESRMEMIDTRKGNKWRTWLQKSLSFGILSN